MSAVDYAGGAGGAPALGDGDEDDEEDNDAAGAEGDGGGWTGFSTAGRTAQGVLFKLNPVPTEQMAEVQAYVRGGAMMQDFVYVRELSGLVNPSQRRDFSFFWESPVVEEHVTDAGRRRRLDEEQKSLAVRSYIRATSTQDAEDTDKYIEAVNRLMKWGEQFDSKDVVRTVSRVVQSFEKRAVRTVLDHPLLQASTVMRHSMAQIPTLPSAGAHLRRLQQRGGVEGIANSLRRSKTVYDAFAGLVAAEITLGEATNGTKNISIHISKVLDMERTNRALTLLKVLEAASPAAVPADTVGLPLMRMRHSLCVRNGVLVVGGEESLTATYVLNIQLPAGGGALSLEGVDTIKITGVFTEDEMLLARQPGGGGGSVEPPEPKRARTAAAQQQPLSLAGLL